MKINLSLQDRQNALLPMLPMAESTNTHAEKQLDPKANRLWETQDLDSAWIFAVFVTKNINQENPSMISDNFLSSQEYTSVLSNTWTFDILE